jgi:CPA2 family monovalent cation:H+ antiporter-2
MPHNVSLIALLAAGFGLALVLGLIAARLRMPPLVGYLLAGVMIGPGTPGFVADVALSGQLAEIGVMLLMFGVGLHFSLADLLAVRKIAVPAPWCRSAPPRCWGAGPGLGLAVGDAVVFGLSLSVASTVVLLRALEARGTSNPPTAASRWAGWWWKTWRWCWCWCCCRRWRRCWAPSPAPRRPSSVGWPSPSA